MGNHKASGILLSASQRMRMAVEQERLKPQYAFEQPDAQTFLLASAVKQNHPEAFDHDNPDDVLIWAFLGDKFLSDNRGGRTRKSGRTN